MEGPLHDVNIAPGERLLNLHFGCALGRNIYMYILMPTCTANRLPEEWLLIGMKLWNSRFLKCPQAPAKSPSLGLADHSWKGTCGSKGGGCLLENRKICSLHSTASGFPAGSGSKESPCCAGDLGSVSGLERSPGEVNAYPLQYFCLGNPMDRGGWWGYRVRHDWMTNTFISQHSLTALQAEAECPGAAMDMHLSLNTERRDMKRPPSLSSS